ncbi:MAG: hypothetical protein MZV70_54555 [Desulfobacterales bacterium]|nr:hypothetical protein [Desulfobacterales bacterium]
MGTSRQPPRSRRVAETTPSSNAAVAMAKGGMQDPDELFTYVSRLAGTTVPPLELAEVRDITKHALEHITRKNLNVAQEVRDWVEGTYGDFQLQDSGQGPGHHREGRQGPRPPDLVMRMVEAGKLARHGTKDGRYRKVEPHADTIDIMGAPTKPLDFKLPFDLHDIVSIYPGNIVSRCGGAQCGQGPAS